MPSYLCACMDAGHDLCVCVCVCCAVVVCAQLVRSLEGQEDFVDVDTDFVDIPLSTASHHDNAAGDPKGIWEVLCARVLFGCLGVRALDCFYLCNRERNMIMIHSHTHTPSHSHTHANTHIHTYTHTHIHTHTHTGVLGRSWGSNAHIAHFQSIRRVTGSHFTARQ